MSQTAEEKLITITVNNKKWDRLRELCQVDHEHYEGMNECSICDEPLIDVITRKLEKLQALKEEVEKLERSPKFSSMHALDILEYFKNLITNLEDNG